MIKNNMINIFRNMIKFNPGKRYHVSRLPQRLIKNLKKKINLLYFKYDNIEYDKDIENMINAI